MCDRPGVPTLPGHERSRLFAHRRGRPGRRRAPVRAGRRAAGRRRAVVADDGRRRRARHARHADRDRPADDPCHPASRRPHRPARRRPDPRRRHGAARDADADLHRGEDPSFFAAVAPPPTLMWFGGGVALAVLSPRADVLPRALATGLPLLWFVTLPASEVGGGILGAAYCLVLARTLAAAPARAHVLAAAAR